MYENMPNQPIICIDMRSFYASCAAVDAGLDVMTTPIAIIGNVEKKGSVVLAASPPMKRNFGVQTGTRLFQIPDHPSIVIIEPKMEFFIRISMEIARLLGEYVPKEAIHVYSIDEIFFSLQSTERFFGPVRSTVMYIQDELFRLFGLHSAAGVGPNLLMAKLALDLDAKKTGYAEWTYEDVPTKLWPVQPLRKMWGIGSRTQKSLNNMGIFSVGDLAHTSLHTLEKKFGIMGNQLYHHAWGIDLSELGAPLLEGQISYGKGQVLFRDYVKTEDILTVILEMCEDVARRTREAGKVGRTISLGLEYSKNAFGGGFHRSRSIDEGTNETMKIYSICKQLLHTHYDGRPVRHISLSITKLEEETSIQLSFFDTKKWEKRKLGAAMDSIRSKYGSSALLRAVSYTDAGTALQRTELIGGHKK